MNLLEYNNKFESIIIMLELTRYNYNVWLMKYKTHGLIALSL